MSSLQQDTFYNIAQDSQCHTHKDKESIHGKMDSNDINRDNGITISKAWKPMIKKHSRILVQKWTTEETGTCRNNKH